MARSMGSGAPARSGRANTNLWRHAGLDFHAPFPIGVQLGGDSGPDVVVEVGPTKSVQLSPAGEVVAELSVGDRRFYTVYRADGGWVIRFDETCEFLVNPDGTRVLCEPGPGCSEGLLGVLMAGTVTSLLLTLRGFAVLHGSAVRWDTRTIVFAGYSGAGKTTMAALCCAAGAELVTDDVVALQAHGEHVASVGLGHEIRLRDAAAGIANLFPDPKPPRRVTADGRLAIQPPTARSETNVISAVVLPRPDRQIKEVVAVPLGPVPATLQLLGNSRLPALVPMDLQRPYFEAVANLVAAVPVVEARVPWGPPFTTSVVAALMDALPTGLA
jgi:hypothetical protein